MTMNGNNDRFTTNIARDMDLPSPARRFENEVSPEPTQYNGDSLKAARRILVAPAIKPTNPKDAIGSGKLPLHLWPETATALGSLGLLDGALKYGRSNFREIGVRASIYYDAAKRHLNAWFEGEERDPDSGLPHLAHALACIAIVVDAEAAGKLNDDRMVRGGYRPWINALTPHVDRLKKLHAEKSPKHYTIADNPCDCHLHLNQCCDKCQGVNREG